MLVRFLQFTNKISFMNSNNQQNQNQKNDSHNQALNNTGNTIKNPDDWKTGEEPMTGAQNSYLHTLAAEAHEEIAEDLTKAKASKKIDELQHKTGRGVENDR